MKKPSTVQIYAAYLAIPILIVLNLVFFRAVRGENYFLWYLKDGPIISMAAGFLGLIWDDVAARKGLVSSNPAEYFGSCLQLVGAFSFSLGTHLRTPKERVQQPRSFATGWDNWSSTFLALMMVGLVIIWLVVVAPLNYIVTLVSGAPARRGLNVPVRRTVAVEKGNQLSVNDVEFAELRDSDNDISFARNPVAVTQVLTAMVLWAVGILYGWLA